MTFPRLHFPPSIKEKSQFQNETRTIREKKNPSLCFGGGKIQIKCDKRTSENSKSGNPQTCDTFIITSFRQLILGFFFLSIFNQERGLFIWEHDSLISWADFFNSFPQNPACFLLLCSNLRYTVCKVLEQISCISASLCQIFLCKNPDKIPRWPMKWSAICQTPISDSQSRRRSPVEHTNGRLPEQEKTCRCWFTLYWISKVRCVGFGGF